MEVPRVAVRPGKPTWFGRVHGRPVLGLPGNAAAALVCAHLFLRPLVLALLGRSADEEGVAALLEGELADNGGSEWYLRATVRVGADARLRVRAFENQDTSLVSVLAAANALIRHPAGAAAVPDGAPVEVRLLDRA
jgi:molybdopterin molybdotransferase